jgi:hypothetical protein
MALCSSHRGPGKNGLAALWSSNCIHNAVVCGWLNVRARTVCATVACCRADLPVTLLDLAV